MSRLPLRALAGALLVAMVLAGCKSGSSKPSPQAAAPSPTPDTQSVACCADGVDLSLARKALLLLIQRAYEKPTSDRLLSAAWDGLVAEAQRQKIRTTDAAKPSLTGSADADFKSFSDGFDAAVRAFRGQADVEQLNYAAISAMTDSLNDSHTTFLPPAVFTQTNQREAGNLGTTTGLRVENATDHPPLVLEVVPDSAAARAGVLPGDSVESVDGRLYSDFTGRGLSRALEAGADGSKLELDIRRAGSARARHVTVVRQTMALDLVHSTILPGNVGYIRIREFPTQVPIELQVKQALGDFDAANTGGVIVDLRGNPGGFVERLQAILSQFVGQTPLYYAVDRSGHDQAAQRSGARLLNQRLVVLVDSGSASSSEIFAAAVQEYHDGLVIGTPSCGCLMGAGIVPLEDRRSGIEVAVYAIETPVEKRQVEKKPIQPDSVVDPDARLLGAGRDPQVEAALQSLGVDAATAQSATQSVIASKP
jgi:carboxyl-terminal processing protease